MAPPLTGKSLILQPRIRPNGAGADTRRCGARAMRARSGLGRRTKEATMTAKLVALVLLCLMTGTAMALQAKAPQAKVTSLMSKDLPENPGKEALMILVEYPPGS